MKHIDRMITTTPDTDSVKFRLADSDHYVVHEVYVRELEKQRNALQHALNSIIHLIDQNYVICDVTMSDIVSIAETNLALVKPLR